MRSNVMEIVWGLFLYSLVNGMGFDVSHSITNLRTQFFSKNECIISAKEMNSRNLHDVQIGLDRNVQMRYICLALPKTGQSI